MELDIYVLWELCNISRIDNILWNFHQSVEFVCIQIENLDFEGIATYFFTTVSFCLTIYLEHTGDTQQLHPICLVWGSCVCVQVCDNPKLKQCDYF